MTKLKEDLGYTNIDSKIGFNRTKKEKSECESNPDSEVVVRSQSA